uniref:Uncharacterized protein n=1 Tax=Cucumis melo TaxID=3656 RepID=A0A9I9EJ34_CUCME
MRMATTLGPYIVHTMTPSFLDFGIFLKIVLSYFNIEFCNFWMPTLFFSIALQSSTWIRKVLPKHLRGLNTDGLNVIFMITVIWKKLLSLLMERRKVSSRNNIELLINMDFCFCAFVFLCDQVSTMDHLAACERTPALGNLDLYLWCFLRISKPIDRGTIESSKFCNLKNLYSKKQKERTNLNLCGARQVHSQEVGKIQLLSNITVSKRSKIFPNDMSDALDGAIEEWHVAMKGMGDR